MSITTPENLENLLAREACRDLVLRSAGFTDSRDAAAFAQLFAEDGELRRPSGEALQGRAAIHAAYAARPANRLTRHLVTNSIVTLTAPDRAEGLSYVLMWSGDRQDAETAFGRPAQPQQLVGEYEDRFVRTPAEGWRIQSRQARFTLYR